MAVIPHEASFSILPTGTVTFLFTDIEGSTVLWEKAPNAMRVSLARHDVLLRTAIETAGGTVFKTVGDAFCAVFAHAPDALAAATQAQNALVSEPWPTEAALWVRMALHTGAAEERDRDYFGPTVNRVARLLSAGHGGQILLSGAAEVLCRSVLPPGAALRELGSHRLKDLEQPETVFQLTHAALADRFPPLNTPGSVPPARTNNLPPPLTSFVGREKEIGAVRALMGKTPLLTLTGTGGAGKTRLALEVAAAARDEYPDGVWLVELALLADSALVPPAVAFVLGVKERAGEVLSQTLAAHLARQHCLILLDNCEHLLAACASLASVLLRACPHVKLLATSREPLAIAGEQVYRVPPLSLPEARETQKVTVEEMLRCEAGRLFIARAQAAQPDFVLTPHSAPALAALCFRLDGLPLALELAAARTRTLSVEQINRKLDTRFRLLTGGDRSALPRQQTLRALVDWSYDLLSEPEKNLFARLSVFAGGWTLQALETVCGFDPIEEWETLDLLTSLVDKSLAVAESGATANRYRLQETLRQYAGEKLGERGEATRLRARHAAYFARFAEDAEARFTGPEQSVWLTHLETEHDNLRAALDDTDSTGECSSDRLRIAGAVWWFWSVRGYFAEGRQRLARALSEAPHARANVRIKALNGAGGLAYTQGDYASARTHYEECLLLARAEGDTKTIAVLLGNLGGMAQSLGENALARTLFDESLMLRRAEGDKYGIAYALGNLAGVLLPGDADAAQRLLTESLALSRELGDKHGVALALGKLGNLAAAASDWAASISLFQESLLLFRELGDRQGIAYSLESAAETALNLSEASRAVTLLGAAAALREAVGAPLSPSEQAGQNEQLAHARILLGDAFSVAWDQGRALEVGQAISLVLGEAPPTT